MQIGKMKLCAWLGALSIVLMAGARAQALDPGTAMEGKYTLVSSTAYEFNPMWRFTKARLEVSRVDQRHMLIAMACQWADAPTAMCDEWWLAQIREGSLYLQDLNTESIAVRFDLSTRTITIVNGNAPTGETRRTDVFKRDPTPAFDKAMTRRMKRARWAFKLMWKPDGIKDEAYSRAKVAFDAE